MKQIGLMGGTFNPIHNAHLAMAAAALEQMSLDEIWFMPSKNPPHKSSRDIVSEDLRSDMIRLAIQGAPQYIFSDFELRHEGTTYTAETLKRLQQEYPADRFYFLMGGDSFFQLETWYHPEQIMKLTTILAFSRNGETDRQMQVRADELAHRYEANIRLLSMEEMPVSSSLIRDRVQNGQPVGALVPPAVEEYIRTNHLYKGSVTT